MLIWRAIPASSRRALKWDASGAALSGLYFGAVFPFLGVIARRDLHASAYLIALLAAGWSVGNLFTPLIAHHIRARAKLPYVVWPSIVARAIFLFMPLAVLAPTYVGLCFAAFAVSALAGPAYAAVIRDAYPVQRRGVLMGLVRVLAVGGSMVGALVAGIVLDRASFRWVFPVAAIAGIAGAALFGRIGFGAAPGDAQPRRARLWEGFTLLTADRPFAVYAAGFFLYGLGNLILGPVIPIFQWDELGITPTWVGYLATTASGLSMVGYVVCGAVCWIAGARSISCFSSSPSLPSLPSSTSARTPSPYCFSQRQLREWPWPAATSPSSMPRCASDRATPSHPTLRCSPSSRPSAASRGRSSAPRSATPSARATSSPSPCACGSHPLQ